jgi:hypothetical protein
VGCIRVTQHAVCTAARPRFFLEVGCTGSPYARIALARPYILTLVRKPDSSVPFFFIHCGYPHYLGTILVLSQAHQARSSAAALRLGIAGQAKSLGVPARE